MPGKSFPSSDWFAIFQFDKWVHAFLFMMLFFIASYEWRKLIIEFSEKRSFYSWIILAYCLFLGALTELIQHFFIPDRFGDWLDFIANSVGAFLGLFLVQKLQNRIFSSIK
jgi:VanZ family protein